MSAAGHIIVVPGQEITSVQGYLRGHGTYVEEGTDGGPPKLLACVAGVVERVNKLISVRPIKSRYIGEVGDLVVGRVTEVQSKRWSVEVGAHRSAVLMLSSVNLPGGQQRMRTYEDQLQMRSFFQEHDLISAEVQQVNSDGGIALHTRSLKYGKLENGQLVSVPPVLIRRLKQHVVSLPDTGVDVILGTNGNVWISRTPPEEWKGKEEGDAAGTGSVAPKAETLTRQRKQHAETETIGEARTNICRVRNAIVALRNVFHLVTPESIMSVYRRSVTMGLQPKDMLSGEAVLALTTKEAT
ncbi:unnamed protein product [Ectocarpus sp. 8 AP-2014]